MAFDPAGAVQSLAKAQADGRLGHAYLISGGSREDRRQLVLGAAQALLGREASSLQEAECEELTILRPSGAIGSLKIEPIREMEKRFHHSAGGALRIGVIMDADRLTPQAANAFLKTLEEPPEGVLLLLLTGQPEAALLPTIVSRCIRIRLTAPPPPGLHSEQGKALRQALAQHFQISESLAGAMTIAGLFSRLLAEEKERGRKESEAQLKAEVEKYRNASEGDWLKEREAHHKARVASSYRIRRSELLGIVHCWMGDALRLACGSEDLCYDEDREATQHVADSLGRDELIRRIEVLSDLASQFHTNVTEALAIEVSFLKAFRSPAHV